MSNDEYRAGQREARQHGLRARQETREARAIRREMDALNGEVEPWLRECGSCDAALPMACTCPPGDYRVILLKVWRAYRSSVTREIGSKEASA